MFGKRYLNRYYDVRITVRYLWWPSEVNAAEAPGYVHRVGSMRSLQKSVTQKRPQFKGVAYDRATAGIFVGTKMTKYGVWPTGP